MNEHDEHQDGKAQPEDAGPGAPTVLRAGSGVDSPVPDLPCDSSSGGDPAAIVSDAAGAAASVLRAGQQALNRAEATTHATIKRGEVANVLDEFAGCATRSALRNVQAVGDLMQVRTLNGLVDWQSSLLNRTLSDWMVTSAKVFSLGSHRA